MGAAVARISLFMPLASAPLAHGSGGAFVHDGRGFRRYALFTTGAAVAGISLFMPLASAPLAHGSGGAFVHDGRGFRRYALFTTGAAVAALGISEGGETRCVSTMRQKTAKKVATFLAVGIRNHYFARIWQSNEIFGG